MQETIGINDLAKKVNDYMKLVGYSDTRIAQHQSAWSRLKVFMSDNNFHEFDATVADSFIYSHLSGRSYDELSRWEKDIIMCVNRLTEYKNTAMIKYRRSKKIYELHGPIGKTMRDYIQFKRNERISQETLDTIARDLQSFLQFLAVSKISDLNSISRELIVEYSVFKTGFHTQYTRHRMLGVLKGYFRYLYDSQKLTLDFSKILPQSKYVKRPKLPSTYSSEEIIKLLNVIDRASPKGKRDYAMVLMTARFGLRASDVCALKFENINWEHNQISLIMKKTRKQIKLPLLAEVGEAIIDYLKYGRPQSKLPYIFLHVIHPYDQLNRSTLHSIIYSYLRKAGICCNSDRKHGPHALRHSLVGILLEKKTPIPVIAEVLGHSTIESTRTYLRIDINSLRQCALNVPPVSTKFYVGGAE